MVVPLIEIGKSRGKKNPGLRVGTRIKSFILAILTIRGPLDLQVRMPSRESAIQIWSPGEVTAEDVNSEVISIYISIKAMGLCEH